MLSPRPAIGLSLRIVAGDSLPVPELWVYGIEADPTGATATFSLLDLSDVEEIEDEAAAVDGIASYTEYGATRWKLRLRYAWASADTAILEGSYYGRFTVTLPASAGVFSAPADRRFTIEVLPATDGVTP
jgi:hypothetical protein